MCVHAHTYAHTHSHTHAHIHVQIHMHIAASISIYRYTGGVYMYKHMHIYMYICTYICISIVILIHIPLYEDAGKHTVLADMKNGCGRWATLPTRSLHDNNRTWADRSQRSLTPPHLNPKRGRRAGTQRRRLMGPTYLTRRYTWRTDKAFVDTHPDKVIVLQIVLHDERKTAHRFI